MQRSFRSPKGEGPAGDQTPRILLHDISSNICVTEPDWHTAVSGFIHEDLNDLSASPPTSPCFRHGFRRWMRRDLKSIRNS